MNFSTNQARQLYVANAYKATAVTEADAVGTISVHGNTEDVYFLYRGVDGISRTDLINKELILYAKATDAKNLERGLKRVDITLDPAVNGGNPVAGQDYLLRILFKEYVGLSPEHLSFKHGMVHAVSGMTASQFYAKLALSLAKNFSRDEFKSLKFLLGATEVTAATKESELTDTYTKLTIEEVKTPWTLGLMESVRVNFYPQPDEIKFEGSEFNWGIVKVVDPVTKVNNGELTADLEYFCMGERGDMYRNVGFPKVIKTNYLVDTSKPYNYFDIHFYYVGSNEMVQKSEKNITIVAPKEGTTANKVLNDIVTAFNNASGLSITPLDA